MAGIRRPDVIASKGPLSWVIDTTVCADAHGANLEVVHQRKSQYYDTDEIREWVRLRTGAVNVRVSALVFNWRGDLAKASHRIIVLLGAVSSIRLLEVKLMEGNCRLLKFFGRASGRWV